MEKDYKRSLRRYHYRRLKKERSWYYRHFDEGPWNDKAQGQLATTAVNCSCRSCGNPRRHFKYITRQEYLSYLNYVDDCNDLNIRVSRKIHHNIYW